MILILISVTQSYNTCGRCILKKIPCNLKYLRSYRIFSIAISVKKNNRDFARISGYYLAINKFGFRRIWRIKQIEEGVIHLGLRPLWITPSSICLINPRDLSCLILHILRKPKPLIALLFIQNNSYLKTAKTCLPASMLSLSSILYV